MNDPLHPLTLSEILDRTAQLYRSRFLIFLGVAAIPAGAIFVVATGAFAFVAWAGANAKHGATTIDILIWIFLSVLMVLVIPAGLAAGALGEAATSDAAARSFLGEAVSIRDAYKTAWKRGWRYLGLFILQWLAIAAAPAIVFCVAIFVMAASKISGVASNDPSPVFGGIVVTLALILGAFAVWMLLRVCLAFPVCVVEQTTAWRALKRSTFLSQGTKGRVFILYLLGLVLNQVLSLALAIPIVIALALIPGLQGQAHAEAMGMIGTFLFYGAVFVVRAVVKPVYGIALSLFYFDQRIRIEGFDIEWMMMRAGMMRAANAVTPEASAAPELASEAPGVPPVAVGHGIETMNAIVEGEKRLSSAPEGSNA